jgi:hypothetical protein
MRFIPEGHPQMNPDERANRVIVELLTKECLDHPELARSRLPFVLAAWNTSPMAALGGCSPFQLEHGRLPRSAVDAKLGIEPASEMTVEHYNNEVLDNIKEGIEAAIRSRTLIKEREQRALDKHTVVIDFKIGDLVRLEQEPDKTTLRPRFSGPYYVIGTVGLNQFIIDTVAGPKTVHMKQLQPYAGTSGPPSEEERRDQARSLQHQPREWCSAGPGPKNALDADTLIGKRIRVWWPTLNRWYDGLVVSRHKGQHVVLYFDGLEEYLEYLVGYSLKRAAKWMLLTPKQPQANASEGGM